MPINSIQTEWVFRGMKAFPFLPKKNDSLSPVPTPKMSHNQHEIFVHCLRLLSYVFFLPEPLITKCRGLPPNPLISPRPRIHLVSTRYYPLAQTIGLIPYGSKLKVVLMLCGLTETLPAVLVKSLGHWNQKRVYQARQRSPSGSGQGLKLPLGQGLKLSLGHCLKSFPGQCL